MVNFSSIIETLINIGFYKVVLPLILVYVIVFAILQKSKIFEGGSSDATFAKKVNAIISFVFALFIVASAQAVMYIQNMIMVVSVILVFILTILLVFGLLFGDRYTDILENPFIKWAAIALTLIVLFGFLLSWVGFWDWFGNWWSGLEMEGDGTFTSLLVIAIIGGILWWVSKGDKSSSE